jgi:hypothetical protein
MANPDQTVHYPPADDNGSNLSQGHFLHLTQASPPEFPAKNAGRVSIGRILSDQDYEGGQKYGNEYPGLPAQRGLRV